MMKGMVGAPATAPPAPGLPGGSGCGGGMGCMGGGGAKPFYPALMGMPSLTPEARQFIATEAARRLGTGSEMIAVGQAGLHQALMVNDPAAMQQAVAGMREGTLQAKSGASALQAINEEQSPRQIALTWFKGQMNTPAGSDSKLGDGPWGLTWLHLTTMAFLVSALLAALLIHYARLRRIDGLVRRLTPRAAPTAGQTPASRGAPSPAAKPPGAAPGGLAKGQAAVDPAARTADSLAKDNAPTGLWSGALRVAAIFRETPTVLTFRLVALDGGPMPFTFRPGQFLSFSAEIDDRPIRRSYSIASSPTQRDYVEITVKREEHGAESRYLHDHVAVGDHLQVKGPSGVFTFTGAEADSIVLISGGVGITPMMCITRYLTDRAFPGEIFFLYGARTVDDFIFREELEHLRKRHANLHVTATMSKPEGVGWTGSIGFLSKEFIAAAVPEIGRRRVHVCGPPVMMDFIKAQLAELGVPKDKIKSEAFASPLPSGFTAPTTPAPAVPPLQADAGAPSAPVAAAAPSAQAEVKFSRSGKTGVLAPDKCVLEAAEAVGVSIDFVCRVGTCGTCVVPLLEGSVTMEVEETRRAA